MKRIEFIAPVESMRGNLGSRQNLVYAPNNNRAFDSIEGQINPALNYEPRLIGARKGRFNYFCVKTKSSVHLTQLAKQTMADLGAVGSMYAAIVRNKSVQPYVNLAAIYHRLVNAEKITISFRKWVSQGLGQMLKNKLSAYTFSDDELFAIVDNPWVLNDIPNVTIREDILVKFWMQMAKYAFVYSIDGNVGLGRKFDHSGYNIMNWEDYFREDINIPNVLNVYAEGDEGYIMYNGRYVTLDGDYQSVAGGYEIYANGVYETTDVAPE